MEIVKTIRIPEGYQIDKERSSDSEIVLKPKSPADDRAKSWEEYVKKMEGKASVYADYYDRLILSVFKSEQPWPLEFADSKTLKAYLAFGKLIKLRNDWVKEWEPDYENDCEPKFAIITVENKISKEGVNYTVNSSMSFPTEKMRDEFFDTFKDLLEQAKSLL